jgi:hypothetical protein
VASSYYPCLMKIPLQRPVALQVLSLSLMFCMLVLTGAIYAQTVPHALHHAHHQATTRGTSLCTWMCAAGQVTETASVALQVKLALIAFLNSPPLHEPDGVPPSTPFTRGPPSLSV